MNAKLLDYILINSSNTNGHCLIFSNLLLLFVMNLVGCQTDRQDVSQFDYLVRIGTRFHPYPAGATGNKWPYINKDRVKSIFCDDFFDDKAMESIRMFKNVEELSLLVAKVTDEGMVILSRMASITDLKLQAPFITDDGLEYLAKLPNLQYLAVDASKFTDNGLRHVKKMPKLKYLSLSGTMVTKDEINNLANSMSWVEIHHD